MEQVKYLEPLTNDRIALCIDEAMRKNNLLACSVSDAQFNHVMRDDSQSIFGSLMMGTDFEVISKDQWCLLVRHFGERKRIVAATL